MENNLARAIRFVAVFAFACSIFPGCGSGDDTPSPKLIGDVVNAGDVGDILVIADLSLGSDAAEIDWDSATEPVPDSDGGRACPVGSSCDDQDPCTSDDQCIEGGQCSGTAIDCSDGLSCTADECSGEGECANFVMTGFCLVAGQCYGEDAPEPGIQCSACKPEIDPEGWTNTEGAACDDSDACTQNDACAEGLCKGLPVNCDDSEVCTKDGCDPHSGCVHTPVEGVCDDGDDCTVGDYCADGTCIGGEEACGSECATDEDCLVYEDGDLCNGIPYCNTETEPYVCEISPDSIVVCPADQETACVESLCEPQTGLCLLTPMNEGGPCDDLDECTAPDSCTNGLCQGIPMPNCGQGGVLMQEGFEGDFPPDGWSMTGETWEKTDSAWSGDGAAMHVSGKADDRLVAGPVNLAQMDSVTLTFWELVEEGEQPASYSVQLSTDGGNAWGPPYWVGPQSCPWSERQIDLSMFAGQAVWISWRYVASSEFMPPGKWYLDEVQVEAE